MKKNKKDYTLRDKKKKSETEAGTKKAGKKYKQ
jgi:hypothetical protein